MTTALVAAAVFIVFLFVGYVIGGSGSPLLVILALAAIGGVIFFFLSGNAREAPLADAALADARRIQAPAGAARLYIVRHGFVGGMQGMDIAVDATHRGQIKSGRALMVDLTPGGHTLTARMARGGDKAAASLALELAPDSVTVVKAGTAIGAATAAVDLAVMTDLNAAKAELDKARFLAWQ